MLDVTKLIPLRLIRLALVVGSFLFAGQVVYLSYLAAAEIYEPPEDATLGDYIFFTYQTLPSLIPAAIAYSMMMIFYAVAAAVWWKRVRKPEGASWREWYEYHKGSIFYYAVLFAGLSAYIFLFKSDALLIALAMWLGLFFGGAFVRPLIGWFTEMESEVPVGPLEDWNDKEE